MLAICRFKANCLETEEVANFLRSLRRLIDALFSYSPLIISLRAMRIASEEITAINEAAAALYLCLKYC